MPRCWQWPERMEAALVTLSTVECVYLLACIRHVFITYASNRTYITTPGPPGAILTLRTKLSLSGHFFHQVPRRLVVTVARTRNEKYATYAYRMAPHVLHCCSHG